MRRSTIALIIVIAALPPLGLAGLGPVPAPDMAVWLATVADAGLQLLGTKTWFAEQRAASARRGATSRPIANRPRIHGAIFRQSLPLDQSSAP